MKLDLRVRKVLQLLGDGKEHAEKEILKHVGWRFGSTFHLWLERTEKLKGLVEPSGTYGHYRITSAGRQTLAQFDMMDTKMQREPEPVFDMRHSPIGFLLRVQVPRGWRGLETKPLAEKLFERRVNWDELGDNVLKLVHFWAFKEDFTGNKPVSYEVLGNDEDTLLIQAHPRRIKQVVELMKRPK